MRLAFLVDKFQSGSSTPGTVRHVKRWEKLRSRNNNKGGKKPLYREALPPFLRYAKAEHVCLLGSIAVTFGTLGKLFDRRGLYGNLRFEVSRSTYSELFSYLRRPSRVTTS
jgi:hypothetical protein